jgi:hypothetical protein
MIVELADGAKIHFGREPETGLSEVGVAEDIAKVTADKFKAALGSLASLVAALEDSVGHMPHRPDKVEMEFGAALTGKMRSPGRLRRRQGGFQGQTRLE